MRCEKIDAELSRFKAPMFTRSWDPTRPRLESRTWPAMILQSKRHAHLQERVGTEVNITGRYL